MKKIAVLAATAALVALSAQATVANPIADTQSFFQGFTLKQVPARGDDLVDGIRHGAPNANGLTFGSNVPARGDELVNGNRVGAPKANGIFAFGKNVPAR